MVLLDFINRCTQSFQRFCERNSFSLNFATNALLLILCLASYVFLLMLYLSKGLWTRSFIYVNEGAIPPTTAIPLCGVLLTGATSSLLTRCAEHSLWYHILSKKPISLAGKRVSPDETHRQAQWTVSPMARLAYVVRGESTTLRLGGLLVFGTAVLNPVLLYGVSPNVTSETTTVVRAPSESAFAAYTLKEFFVGNLPDCECYLCTVSEIWLTTM